MGFIAELKRRHVFRVGIAYLVLGWVLVQAADVIFPILQFPGWTITFVAVLTILGFPLAVILAWAFELTPEGVIRDTGVGVVATDTGEQTPTVQQPSNEPPSEHSIAVLPFVNMSDDASNEYFSDGLAEELLNLLVHVPALHVAARTSSFSFKGEKIDIPAIAEKLKVANVLEGSVRKAGNRVRVTAQLVKAADGFHLWSETFDRTLNDIFAVQDEIASAVVDALKISLLDEVPKARQTNPEAYALYLQGIYFSEFGDNEHLEKAVGVFKQALAIDPDYAPAWDGLAGTYVSQMNGGMLATKDGISLARAAGERALALDDKLAEAHAGKALLNMTFDWDWPGAKAAIERALELAPGSARVILRAGKLASILGRYEEATAHYQQAIALDPLQTRGYIWLALDLMAASRLDEARAPLLQALNLNSQRQCAHQLLGLVLLLQGKLEAAHEEMQKEPEGIWRAHGIPLSLYALERHEEADAALHAEIDAHSRDGPFQIAEVYGFRGEIDQAFHWLERAHEERDGGLNNLLGSPLLTGLHEDPRWPAFLDKMGLPKSVS